jgi:kynurenine formamidase
MKSKRIRLGSNEFLVIDLNNPLKLDQEVYPGDPKPIRKVFTDIQETGWHHYIHEISDHHFQPHGDAPNHQNPELIDRGFEIFGLDYCFNPAFLIDFSTSPKAQNVDGIPFQVEIDLDDLEPFEDLFKTKGAVVLRTGYDLWLEQNLPHQPDLLPYLTKPAADYLASFKNLNVVATDSMTVDPDGSHEAHQSLKDKLIVECMVNLHGIPMGKREDFDLQTSPVKIVGATGGPITAYAFIPFT